MGWQGADILDAIQLRLLDVFIGRCASAAALALLFYEHLITFFDEVQLIWPAKFGIVKAIFFFNRYFAPIWIATSFNLTSGFANFLNDSICRHWMISSICFEVVNIQMLNFIVATRVYDIWQSQRLAFFVLAPFWITHFVLDVFIVTNRVIHNSKTYVYVPSLNMCAAEVGRTWTLWLNGIIYHALILLLLLWLWLSTPRTIQTPFVRLVIRDGFLYFATVFTAMTFNLLVLRYARPSLSLLPHTSVWVVLSNSLSRMLLSMRSVQTPEEWGQRATIALPRKDIELGGTNSWFKHAMYTN